MSVLRLLLSMVGLVVLVWQVTLGMVSPPVIFVGFLLALSGKAWDDVAYARGHTRPDPRLVRETPQDKLLGGLHEAFFKLDLSEESVAWLEVEVDRVLRRGSWQAWQGPVEEASIGRPIRLIEAYTKRAEVRAERDKAAKSYRKGNS